MNKRPRYPQELRERAVRLVREHRGEYPSEWAAITSIAGIAGDRDRSPAPVAATGAARAAAWAWCQR
jgi:hypothetical protein